MSVPHRDDEPDDPRESVEPGDAADDGRAREDAAWQAIVAAYGDRPTWDDAAARPHDDAVAPVAREEHPAGRGAELRGDDEVEPDLARAPEEHFVPQPTPPVPWPTPQRLVAWLGLFGVPSFVLVALLARIDVASWVGVLLMLWFVGGFCYLVASMRTERDDPDDGAVV